MNSTNRKRKNDCLNVYNLWISWFVERLSLHSPKCHTQTCIMPWNTQNVYEVSKFFPQVCLFQDEKLSLNLNHLPNPFLFPPNLFYYLVVEFPSVILSHSLGRPWALDTTDTSLSRTLPLRQFHSAIAIFGASSCKLGGCFYLCFGILIYCSRI